LKTVLVAGVVVRDDDRVPFYADISVQALKQILGQVVGHRDQDFKTLLPRDVIEQFSQSACRVPARVRRDWTKKSGTASSRGRHL
jgi:hypothetical protein